MVCTVCYSAITYFEIFPKNDKWVMFRIKDRQIYLKVKVKSFLMGFLVHQIKEGIKAFDI
jgi:hypothetical protein